jgi:hypothetical protein
MMGISIRDHHRVDPAAPLQQPEHGYFAGCSTAMLSLAMPSKIALVDFNLPGEWRASIYLLSNDLAQPVVKVSRSFAVYTEQIRSRSGSDASYKKFSQTILLFFR